MIEYEEDDDDGAAAAEASRSRGLPDGERGAASPDGGSIEYSVEDGVGGGSSDASPVESGSVEDDDEGRLGARGQVLVFEDLQVRLDHSAGNRIRPIGHSAIMIPLLPVSLSL